MCVSASAKKIITSETELHDIRARYMNTHMYTYMGVSLLFTHVILETTSHHGSCVPTPVSIPIPIPMAVTIPIIYKYRCQSYANTDTNNIPMIYGLVWALAWMKCGLDKGTPG